MIEQLLGNYQKINTGLLNTQKLGSHPSHPVTEAMAVAGPQVRLLH